VILDWAEIEYEDELEDEDDWGTIASKEKRADDERISSCRDLTIVFAPLLQGMRPRFP
jgi:hypothetical protein